MLSSLDWSQPVQRRKREDGRARRIRIADKKKGQPVSTSRAWPMSDVARTVAHVSSSTCPHDGDDFVLARELREEVPRIRGAVGHAVAFRTENREILANEEIGRR